MVVSNEYERMLAIVASANGLEDIHLGVKGVFDVTRKLHSDNVLNKQQMRAINGQARAGDFDGAVRGIVRIWSRT